ncbi:hypothetical protein RB594_001195 [Gaeumannomyces avenae]
MIPKLIDALTAAATLTLRILTVLFVRHHPLGPRYLPRIYASFALSLAGLSAQLIYPRTQRPKRRRRFLAPLLGWLDPARPFSSTVGVAINYICVAACLDFVYRAHLIHQSGDLAFSRLSYVGDTTASVVVRTPWGDAEDEILVSITATATAGSGGIVEARQTIPILPDDDFVGTFYFTGLVPRASYSYSIKDARRPDMQPSPGYTLQGTFQTLPRPAEHPKRWSLVYASPSWTPRLRSMARPHAYDGHEIRNDWAANETGLYRDAMAPYSAYQGRANPPPAEEGDTHYEFRRGGVSFFVLDTRRYRSGADVPDGPGKTMLGARQRASLEAWLRRRDDDDAPWKVVERDVILDAMKETGGAVTLGGDRHEHATTMFPAVKLGDKPVIEFSTSPLNQFYEPFDRYHKQIEATDVSIHLHPWGNSKFDIVTFDTSTKGRLLVRYDLVVDGKKTWEYDWENIRT